MIYTKFGNFKILTVSLCSLKAVSWRIAMEMWKQLLAEKIRHWKAKKKKVQRDNVDFGESDKYMKREDKNNH